MMTVQIVVVKYFEITMKQLGSIAKYFVVRNVVLGMKKLESWKTKMSNCDECGGMITIGYNEDGSVDGWYCSECGLDVRDSKERRFIKMAILTAKEAGEVESRQRESRKERSYGRKRGYTCALCFELFKSLSRPEADEEMLKIEAKQRGTEELGTDLSRFLLRQELEAHIKLIHGGRKEYRRKLVDDKKWKVEVRKLDNLNKETVGNSNCKGSREKR